MTRHTLSEKVLQKIDEEKIAPKPRWVMLLKNNLLWTIGIIALFIGGLSIASVIHITGNHDWALYAESKGNPIMFIITALPYFWLITLILFVAVAQYNIRHTKSGYRFSPAAVVAGIIAISAILGALSLFTDFPRTLDIALTQKLPVYEHMHAMHHVIWESPENGRLSGRVTNIIDDDSFTIKTRTQTEWTVRFDGDLTTIHVGDLTRMIGEQEDDAVFTAHVITLIPENTEQPGWHGFRRRNERKISPLRTRY